MIAFIFWLSVGIIFYTYLGYPVLIALLAKLRPEQAYSGGNEPSITLLIAAYNEEACIEARLFNALSMEYPKDKIQILVAADGSDDRTTEIVSRFKQKGVELSYQPERRGKSAAIDRAMSMVTGEIVVFSDANNMYAPMTLRNLVLPFGDPKVGVVSGAKHILKEGGALGVSEGLYWKYESFIKRQESRLSSCIGVSGEIFAIRRSCYLPTSNSIINDDTNISMNILNRGFSIVYAPEAVSYENVSLTAQDEITRRTKISAGRYQAISKSYKVNPFIHPILFWQIFSHKILRLVIPFAMIAAFLANFVSLFAHSEIKSTSIFDLLWPKNWLFFIGQLLFYLVAMFGNLIMPKGKLGKILYLPTFLLNSNIASFKGFLQFFTKKENELWKRVPRYGERQEKRE